VYVLIHLIIMSLISKFTFFSLMHMLENCYTNNEWSLVHLLYSCQSEYIEHVVECASQVLSRKRDSFNGLYTESMNSCAQCVIQLFKFQTIEVSYIWSTPCSFNRCLFFVVMIILLPSLNHSRLLHKASVLL
jgi:hypothetical protein